MINFNTFRILFLGLVLITLILMYFIGLNYIFLLVEFGLFFKMSFMFSFFIRSNFYVKAFCSAAHAHNKIAITFDDGPVKIITPQVLDILQRFNVKATFFCIGKNIEGNEDILARIYAEGHQIGNHTFSHSNFFGFFSSKSIINELQKTAKTIEAVTGGANKIFRPPFGITNPNIKKAIEFLDYRLIGWSVRSYDGTLRDKKLILKNATQHLKSGDIVLFHDNHPQIIDVLEQFLIHVFASGLKPVRIDELEF